MSEQKFKIGDAVQHKSGGPKMIVKDFHEQEVICEWFDKNTPCEKAFRVDVLSSTNQEPSDMGQ